MDTSREGDVVAPPETPAGDVISPSPVATQEDDSHPEPSNKEQADVIHTSAGDKSVVPPNTQTGDIIQSSPPGTQVDDMETEPTQKEPSDLVGKSPLDDVGKSPDTTAGASGISKDADDNLDSTRDVVDHDPGLEETNDRTPADGDNATTQPSVDRQTNKSDCSNLIEPPKVNPLGSETPSQEPSVKPTNPDKSSKQVEVDQPRLKDPPIGSENQVQRLLPIQMCLIHQFKRS